MNLGNVTVMTKKRRVFSLVFMFLITAYFITIYSPVRIEFSALLDASEYSKVERRNAERRERIERVCKQKENVSDYPKYIRWFSLITNKRFGITWCSNYKAASRSWKYNMCILQGTPEDELKEMFDNDEYGCFLQSLKGSENLNESATFLIVRHPFERLLSAYRDRLENTRTSYFEAYYNLYGHHIVDAYRTSNSSQIVPSFEEFVLYLLNEPMNDIHWLPYYRACSPCVINYDIIANTETLAEDSMYVIQRNNLHKYLRPKKFGVYKTSKVSRDYFSSLYKKQVVDLYNKLKFDFDLFGYDPQQYIDWAKPGYIG